MTSLQHILAELERIDLLIQVQVQRAGQDQESYDQFRGLEIAEHEVESLLARPIGLPHWATSDNVAPALPEVRASLERMAADIAQRKAESVQRGITLRLDELARLLKLTPFDIDVLLVSLAPELDLRYERLYAYLQDDVTRRRPSVDLVLNLLCPSFQAKLAARHRLSPGAPLCRHRLLLLYDDPSHNQPPLLSKYLKVDERIVNYLLDSDEPDATLLPYVQLAVPHARLEEVLLPNDVKDRLALLVKENPVRDQGMVLYFQGPYGVGKQTTAEALSQELASRLLVIDGNRLLSGGEATFETLVPLIMREALLQGASLYYQGFDPLLADDKRGCLETLLRELENRPGLTFLAGEAPWEPADALHDLSFHRIEFPRPSYDQRAQLWTRSLNGQAPLGDDLDLGSLANKFRLSGGQIQDAAATARNLALWRDPEHAQVTMDDLYAASRLQSNTRLVALARKITPRYTWEDIILPPDRLQQLREIRNYVKHRALVYGEWGFDHKLSLGKGLNILFAGPSGTGKTMAAEIMAGELGLDLYKIDLSGVVSKYIGETEKNLARIFDEAETSNAILFFDEADALFGRRSEVRDAHDRYANIEISYLLQKMEEYDGVVILATNLRKNMDEAFVRRMHFAVEFPFPSQKDRRRIWEGVWPQDIPLSPDLDPDFLARRFEVAGGNIRNIALAAAFLAAEDGGVVGMAHLISATRREYQKMGKVVVDEEFGEYAGLAGVQ